MPQAPVRVERGECRPYVDPVADLDLVDVADPDVAQTALGARQELPFRDAVVDGVRGRRRRRLVAGRGPAGGSGAGSGSSGPVAVSSRAVPVARSYQAVCWKRVSVCRGVSSARSGDGRSSMSQAAR
ncbi:hypothetical protein GCM10025734_28230 [Kitasatospora paranensis]